MKGNAQIRKVSLGFEDHGILTSFLFLEQDSFNQGFGGYCLGNHTINHVACGMWIRRVLDTLEVDDWNDLEGKYVRVDGEEYGKIFGIGHICKDKWFYPEKEFAEIDKEKKE